jgi:hypothetical protein
LQPTTPLGCSVGRWDGDALVVRAASTGRTSIPTAARRRSRRRRRAFSVDPATDQLVWLTVTDPAT